MRLLYTQTTMPFEIWGFPGCSVVENPPANQETQLWSLVRKIPQRSKWQPAPVLLPGESHGQEEPGGLQSTGSQRVGHEHTSVWCIRLFIEDFHVYVHQVFDLFSCNVSRPWYQGGVVLVEWTCREFFPCLIFGRVHELSVFENNWSNSSGLDFMERGVCVCNYICIYIYIYLYI